MNSLITRLAVCFVAAFAVVALMASTSDAATPKQKATKLLQGKRFSTYIGGNYTSSGIDRTVDLCPGGGFLYQSTFTFTSDVTDYTDSSGYSQETVRGSWKVAKARVGRSSGWAKVRWVSETGERGSLKIIANTRGVYVAGYPVEVTRSPVC
jgi:hypothetical protein